MWAQLALPNSSRVNVINVYLPPASSLTKRGIEEDTARDAVTSILTHIPPQMPTIVCGDFNTRIGQLTPKFDSSCRPRESEDKRVCPRAPWLLDICELHCLHILNGRQPQPPAPFTCQIHWGQSTVDYILSTEGSQEIEYDHRATLAISDHSLLITHLPTTTRTSTLNPST
jgi:endonuclease/exonuclease/phosphatase family metal-dependent hydrolase